MPTTNGASGSWGSRRTAGPRHEGAGACVRRATGHRCTGRRHRRQLRPTVRATPRERQRRVRRKRALLELEPMAPPESDRHARHRRELREHEHHEEFPEQAAHRYSQTSW